MFLKESIQIFTGNKIKQLVSERLQSLLQKKEVLLFVCINPDTKVEYRWKKNCTKSEYQTGKQWCSLTSIAHMEDFERIHQVLQITTTSPPHCVPAKDTCRIDNQILAQTFLFLVDFYMNYLSCISTP